MGDDSEIKNLMEQAIFSSDEAVVARGPSRCTMYVVDASVIGPNCRPDMHVMQSTGFCQCGEVIA